MGLFHLLLIRYNHVAFNWSYAEPVLAPFGSCSSECYQGRKFIFHPDVPVYRDLRNDVTSQRLYSPVFFDSYKFQLDLQPVLGPCISLPWQPFIYSVHTGMPLILSNLNLKKNECVGVYAGVEPANYSLYIGLSLPFD